MPQKQWLACRVEPGMFSSERLVRIRLRDGRDVTFLVPVEAVKETAGGEGQIAVRVFDRDGGAWVEIPTPNPVAVPADTDKLNAA